MGNDRYWQVLQNVTSKNLNYKKNAIFVMYIFSNKATGTVKKKRRVYCVTINKELTNNTNAMDPNIVNYNKPCEM